MHIDFVVVLPDFALQVHASDADPLAIVGGLEGNQLHLHEHVFLLAELVVDLKERLLSKALDNGRASEGFIAFLLHDGLDGGEGLLPDQFCQQEFILLAFLHLVVVGGVLQVFVVEQVVQDG